MKILKSLLSIMLAFAMVISTSTFVFAEETISSHEYTVEDIKSLEPYIS